MKHVWPWLASNGSGVDLGGGGLKLHGVLQYLFASSITLADQAARKQGWHAYGRTGWITPDGNEVHFICFEEQLAVIGKRILSTSWVSCHQRSDGLTASGYSSERDVMNPLHATIEEFAADGYTHVECRNAPSGQCQRLLPFLPAHYFQK